jgi:hypothetical protein
MFLGPARTWLNSLAPDSINSWPEFEAAFVRNFSTTYTRPGRPRQLAECVQGKGESDGHFLKRWTTLRNTCEGVLESQAILYFTDGLQDGLLKHKLMRSEPTTMIAVLEIAEKYATADAGMQRALRVDAAGQLVTEQAPRRPAAQEPAVGGSRRDNRDNRSKRKDDQRDGRYGSRQVAAVEEGRPAAEGSRRQKGTDRPWKARLTYEQMLDAPCSHHSGAKPSNHTNRQCSWNQRLRAEPDPAAATPPAGGGQGAGRNDRRGDRGRDDRNNRDLQPVRREEEAREAYPRRDAAYVVFTSEPGDKRSQRQRSLEVNAVVPAVP